MEKTELEKAHNDVMTTSEMAAKFAVKSFLAPFCYATNKETGEKVVIQFQHEPRFYFNVRNAEGRVEQLRESSSGITISEM